MYPEYVLNITNLLYIYFKVSTAEAIVKHFEGENADIVVCDGAPDVTGKYNEM